MLGPGEGQKESEWDASRDSQDCILELEIQGIYRKDVEFYSRLGLKCTAIRHSNVYGKHDKFDLEITYCSEQQ